MTLSRSPRFLTTLVLSICFLLGGLVGAQPSAATTRSCPVPAYPGGDGNGYFTGRIKATNVTCSSARKLVLAYYKCRVRAGGKQGQLQRPHGERPAAAPRAAPRSGRSTSQFNAKVTCSKGGKKVIHTLPAEHGASRRRASGGGEAHDAAVALLDDPPVADEQVDVPEHLRQRQVGLRDRDVAPQRLRDLVGRDAAPWRSAGGSSRRGARASGSARR